MNCVPTNVIKPTMCLYDCITDCPTNAAAESCTGPPSPSTVKI